MTDSKRDLFGQPIGEPDREWKTRYLNFKYLKAFAYLILIFDVLAFMGSLYSEMKWMILFFGGNMYFVLAYLKSRALLDKYISDQK